ncbi:nicotinate-nucleotide--dimethylbenzimidazole phosphoribosyltransferase CobT (plasmid) [Peptoclostridium acidaminophilum DSM 3953]|uniref:Nicotinate-nucleotide--dimethylbenzimidazole phosphoribosyltransferase n=1 Tax=Peptoclostridium acidaminophilum DSM 3953 TaxID=1286171 RepID=W8TN06_PEPAC|nr:nicotinate-nucleotide--dimethylbenzimidazole phosphoribosyltransferase [Peptoclostridium acidaminophilum]AHM57572.1 nicotinate-nucleotide--dimethylbenzimidazole phosphoribosyltransferase CobT [Peptoclostridium acidaminophilum DSM 3953]
MKLLNSTIEKIKGLDESFVAAARTRMDNLIKPVGSLGRLEELAVQLSGITSSMHPVVDKKAVIVMSADNGVCCEGVAAAPPVVTLMMTNFIANGVSGMASIARTAGAGVVVVDIGVDGNVENDNVLVRKVRYGTGNIAEGPAMTREEAIKAIETGIEVANEQIERGVKLIATGEMGIGNTTTSTAVLSVLSGVHPSEITGVGANLPGDKIAHKVEVILKALAVNQAVKNDPIDLISKLGGLDMAGMAGIMLSCAASRIPCVVDGYISTVSALLACSLCPNVRDFLIPSHASFEKGSALASELLGLRPMLHMDMRLGEGSGAALAFGIIDAAAAISKDMITFEEAGIGTV